MIGNEPLCNNFREKIKERFESEILRSEIESNASNPHTDIICDNDCANEHIYTIETVCPFCDQELNTVHNLNTHVEKYHNIDRIKLPDIQAAMYCYYHQTQIELCSTSPLQARVRQTSSSESKANIKSSGSDIRKRLSFLRIRRAKSLVHPKKKLQQVDATETGKTEILMKNALKKVQSKDWEEPLGRCLIDISRVLDSLDSWNSWDLILGASVAICIPLLNFTSLNQNELDKLKTEILNDGKVDPTSPSIEKLFSRLYSEHMESFASEYAYNSTTVSKVRSGMQSTITKLTGCLRNTTVILSEFSKILSLGNEITKLDSFTEIIRSIEEAFKYLLAKNETLHEIINGPTMENYWFQLKTANKDCLNVMNICNFVDIYITPKNIVIFWF